MAASGKVIQECVKKVVKISMEFSLKCAKAHPYVSCTVIFNLLLYLCFPWLFWTIIYSAGFLTFTASMAKIYFRFSNNNNNNKAGNKKIEDEKNNPDPKPSTTTRKLMRNDVNARSVRRRRPIELSTEESPSQQPKGEEEKKTVFSSTIDNVTVDKCPVIEEDPKEIRVVQVDPITTHKDRSALDSLRGLRVRKSDAGKGDRESENSDSTEEDERDKEENKKAVQWNEDDQKNLMDLGLSEIERNQRLESLIARRRARKFLSLQVRRSLMNMDRAEPYGRLNPISIPKNNQLLTSQASPMPGSAPSVFRPMNPFDLPYDPQEEKPNLTGGSFHQEFLPVLQKEMFCRHESFSLGPFFPGEFNLDEEEASLFRDEAIRQQGNFKGHENQQLESRLDQEETDKIIEVAPSQPAMPESSKIAKDYIQGPEQEEQETEEVQKKMMPSDNSSCCSSSSSGSEMDLPFSRIDRAAILESLGSPLRRNLSANRDIRNEILNNDNGKMEVPDRFFFTQKAIRHKTTVSIASDLQVEVSEISSSPPLTIDGSISPYDEDESRLRDIHEVTENNEISEDPVVKQEVDEKIIEEGHHRRSSPISTFEENLQITSGSGSGSGSDSTRAISSQSLTFPDPEFIASSQSLTFPDPEFIASSQTLTFPAPEYIASRSTGDPPAERPRNSENDDKHENPSHSVDNFEEESPTKNLVFDSLIPEAGPHVIDWSMASSPQSIGYPEIQSEIIDEHRNIFQHHQPPGENHNAESSQNFEHDQKITDDLVFLQVDGSFPSHQAPPFSPLLPQSMVQQLSMASASSSSPTSVLQPKFSIDQRSYSNLSEDMVQPFIRQLTEINVVPGEPALSSEDSASHDDRIQGTDADDQTSQDTSTTSPPEAGLPERASEQATERNREILGSYGSTEDLPNLAKETVSRSLEEKNENEHEPEPGGNINIETSGSDEKKMEELADDAGPEKQQEPKLDDENKSELDKPFQAESGSDTAEEVKEIHPQVERGEEISPHNHIASGETQEEVLKPPGKPVEEGTGHSEQGPE